MLPSKIVGDIVNDEGDKVTDAVGSPALVQPQWCDPTLDLNGLCHCDSQECVPHSPYLSYSQRWSYPPCREPSFRVAYIDDALVAQALELDHMGR